MAIGIIGAAAVVVYTWASVWLANYPAPWSAPWQIRQQGGWWAATNAAIRLAALGGIAAVGAYPFTPAAPGYGHPLWWFEPAPRQTHGTVDLTWLLILIASVALIPLAVVILRRTHLRRAVQTRPRAGSIQAPDQPGLDALVGEALTAMISAKDPRRAILACYAQMERSLARRGIPRNPDETALEYAARLLIQAGAPSEPVQSLTTLFHLAGFSTRTMDELMRETAIRSLREISGAAP